MKVTTVFRVIIPFMMLYSVAYLIVTHNNALHKPGPHPQHHPILVRGALVETDASEGTEWKGGQLVEVFSGPPLNQWFPALVISVNNTDDTIIIKFSHTSVTSEFQTKWRI
eukprot:m.187588 g.187588  ORF g.187588 m.187588 type:complete len:111 (+) comp15610_c0_seq2:332-664(+)